MELKNSPTDVFQRTERNFLVLFSTLTLMVGMAIFKKAALIVTLFMLIGVLSYSMVLEVAGYYMSYYPNDELRGWFIVVLPELVMIGLMVSHIPNKCKVPFLNVRISFTNLISKVLVALIFTITVAAAGLHTLGPSLEELMQSKRENELIKLLEDEKRDLQRDSKSFHETSQRTNLAITARAKRENREEMKQLLRTKQSSMLPVIEIALIFILRVVIQTANLLFAYYLGYLYRLPPSRLNSTNEGYPVVAPNPSISQRQTTYNNAVKGQNGRFVSAKKNPA